MTAPFARQDKIATSPSVGLVFDDQGLMLGPEVVAWCEDGRGGQRRYRIKPAAEIAWTLRLAYGEAPDDVIVRCARSLQRVVDLLKDGDEARAGVQAVLALLPAISLEGLAKLAASQDLRRASDAYLTEDRISADEAGAGEWTSDGGGAVEPDLQPAEFKGATPARRRPFVQLHLADALAGAKLLHVPVENILGLSALESSWGLGKFATVKRNNFFNMHFPAPFSNGWVSSDGGTRVATFATYADSLKSFIKVSGALVAGKTDPADFARVLQDAGLFGINPDGSKVATFVRSTARTMIGIRALVRGNQT